MVDLPYRVGLGEDMHRLGADAPLMIAGVQIAAQGGAHAHSDGDVVLHALVDALLGALALGDIGDHFPPSDQSYHNIASKMLLFKALELVQKAGYQVANVDITVRLEQPKLYPFKEQMRQQLSDFLNIYPQQVSLKAKTSEQVDAVGEGRAIFAQAAVLLNKII